MDSTTILIVISVINATFLLVLTGLSMAANRKIDHVAHATNSLTDRLVESTRTEAHAAGVKEGKITKTRGNN